jgi:S-adenosylmethionine decarboxylase
MQLYRNDSFISGFDALSDLPNPGFFEGAEKLLEIWFAPGPGTRSLREIGRADLEDMLRLVKCEIVGVMSNDHCDSYVLRYGQYSWSRC